MTRGQTTRWLRERAAYDAGVANQLERALRRAANDAPEDRDAEERELIDTLRTSAGMFLAAVNHLNGVSPE